MSFMKRPRDEDDIHEKNASAQSVPKKLKLGDNTLPSEASEIPDFAPGAPNTYVDDDDEVQEGHSESEQEDEEFEKKMSKLKEKGVNRDKELLHTARLRAQGINLEDEDDGNKASTADEDMDDIFGEPTSIRTSSTAEEEEETPGADKTVDSETYARQLQEKLRSIKTAPTAAAGILADDEEYQARKRRLMASFSDTTGLMAARVDEEYGEDGRLLTRAEKYSDDAWLQEMVDKRDATGADASEDEEEEETAKKPRRADPVADKMSALAERDQQLWRSLESAQERVDPYPVLRAIVRFMRPGETVAGALRRMRPPALETKKKNGKEKEVHAMEDQSMNAEEQAAARAAELQKKRAQGEFAMMTDAVNTLMGQGEYGAMSKKHEDLVDAIHRIEQQRKLPSSVAQWLPKKATSWFIKWNGQEEAHGPNTNEQMKEWSDAGYFTMHSCLVAPEGSNDWKIPNRELFE